MTSSWEGSSNRFTWHLRCEHPLQLTFPRAYYRCLSSKTQFLFPSLAPSLGVLSPCTGLSTVMCLWACELWPQVQLHSWSHAEGVTSFSVSHLWCQAVLYVPQAPSASLAGRWMPAPLLPEVFYSPPPTSSTLTLSPPCLMSSLLSSIFNCSLKYRLPSSALKHISDFENKIIPYTDILSLLLTDISHTPVLTAEHHSCMTLFF